MAANSRLASARRLWLVAQLELRESLGRPLFLFWALFMGFNAFMASRGSWIMRSNSTSLGSNLAYVNSEYQIAYIAALIGFMLVSFFVAMVSSTPLIRDAESRVGELLHSTPLTAGEYVWGKFLAAAATCMALIAAYLVSFVLFTQAFSDPSQPGIYGPFDFRSHVVPLLVFLAPGVLFMAGASFALGRFTGRPAVVFLLPTALLLFYFSFFWSWYPREQGPELRTFFQLVDPSGFRWLRQTWLTVDRGIRFYNQHPIDYSAGFLASRLALVLIGLGLVDLTRRDFAHGLGEADSGRRRRTAVPPAAASLAPPKVTAPLAALGMTVRPRGRFAAMLVVARAEIAELLSHPALYVLFPAALIFLGIQLANLGGLYRDKLLLTSGMSAVESLETLTVWLTLLLLFYGVEALRRERATRMDGLVYSTPAPTSSLVLGKLLANLALAVVLLVGAFATSALLMAQQGRVGVEIRPFLIVWGLLLLPTAIVWSAFVMAVFGVTRSATATFGAGIAVLAVTVWSFTRNHMSWVGNWPLIRAVRWTDMGTLPLDRTALALNRALALALAALFVYLAIRLFERRDRDRLSSSLAGRPEERRRLLLHASLLAAVPLALGIALWADVNKGFEGGALIVRHREYWRKNHATWLNAPLPYVTRVDLDLDLDPATRSFRVHGYYDLVNRKAEPLPWFPVTGGARWRGLSWTLDGRPWHPEDRYDLYVFRLPRPLPAGGTLRLGFQYSGVLLGGDSRNGGQVALGEFLLPAGGVVTGRNPDFVPVVGYVEDLGVEEERNRYEPRIYPPDFYRGITDSDIDRSEITQRVRITVPADLQVTSTGELASEEVRDGRRTSVWVSGYPLRVFNVALGHWVVRRGHGTAVYYHPGHPWNVDTMLAALDGAREHYAAWFMPFPWRELRLNEFPNLAEYGRGNATNIFFSEGVGFLSRPSQDIDAPFAVAAHEAAHSWWGHLVAPGAGPGGVVMSEGAANFSTMLLIETVLGPRQRQGFAYESEAFYGEYRQPSEEKPLVDTYRFRPADTTVIYDKGGWVFWMLMHRMGPDAFFQGTRHFFQLYHGNPDHPMIQDFVAAMRPYAPDKAAFDDFVRQWFFEVVIPEYRLSEVRKEKAGAGWEVTARVANAGTGRMPVEVAATSGERFTPEFRGMRTTIVLGPGEARAIKIPCPFEPDRLVVDPDGKVLQLQRHAASARL
jgi:ABC-type transport system involved in multi-copper enzyme maturation permease subunit